MKKLLVLGLVLTSAAGFSYTLDDGVSEDAIGATAGGTIIWANQFTVTAGNETITAVRGAWGSTVMTNGHAVTAILWSDPNNDLDPTDGAIVSQVAGVVANQGTDIFNVYDIPDITLNVGDSFFVGFISTHAAGEFIASIDQTAPVSNRSWINIGNTLAGGFTTESVGLAGNWMIRADSTSAVPEPMTMTVLGAGALALLRKRKK